MAKQSDPQRRQCGPCKLCCKTLAVVPLGKPTGEWCPLVCATGCSVYDERISNCRDFQCLWLLGYFRDEDRPDMTDVVMYEEHITDEPNLVAVSEAHPGAAGRNPRVKEMIREVLESGTSVVVRNRISVAKADLDGRIVKFQVDADDFLKVRVLPTPAQVHQISPQWTPVNPDSNGAASESTSTGEQTSDP